MTKRKIISAALAALALTLCSCSTVSDSGDLPMPPPNTFPPQNSVSETTAETTTAVVTEAQTTAVVVSSTEAAELLRGNIYDVKGRLLSSTNTDIAEPRRIYAEEYAVPFANVITEMSDGYDTAFNDKLTVKNPSPVNGSDKVGQSIQITLDADIQKKLYEYMQSVNLDGTVVVMRTDGSIMAQVSYPSYEPNAVAEQKYDEKLAWGDCGNKAFQNYQPGSCFKIMSEVIADKHGITSLYDDGEWKFDGTSIVNWDHDTNPNYPMERSLASAFVNSSNIFFAKAFDEIGTEAVLADLNELFHFGTDIECDFGPIHNNIEIYCSDDLRRTAFGQSYILTCPIYLAALGREAAFGDMVRPFVLKNTVDTADPSSVTGSGSRPGEVIASIPENLRPNLLEGMRGVASNLGVYVPAGYTLYAKTGTAETWEGDFLYITGCLKKSSDSGSDSYDYSSYNGSYVIVMELQNPGAHGFSFASDSAQIYQGVINTVLGS